MPALTATCVPPAPTSSGVAWISPVPRDSRAPSAGQDVPQGCPQSPKLVGDTSTSLLSPYSSSTRGSPPHSPSLIADTWPGANLSPGAPHAIRAFN